MVKEIPLTQGKVALVDDADYDWLNQWKWHCHKDRNKFYARRTVMVGKNWKTIRMHRLILAAPTGREVDHINGDGLDNQRRNLRTCTTQENQRNRRANAQTSSVFKGVRHTRNKRWIASIKIDGKDHHLGSFDSENEAAESYNEAALRLFGEFARLNAISRQEEEGGFHAAAQPN